LIPNRQGIEDAIRELDLTAGVPDVTRRDPELATGSQSSPEKDFSRDYLLLGSQDEVFLGK
jgi:hypothetical protein